MLDSASSGRSLLLFLAEISSKIGKFIFQTEPAGEAPLVLRSGVESENQEVSRPGEQEAQLYTADIAPPLSILWIPYNLLKTND